MTSWVVVDDDNDDFIIGIDVACSDEVASVVTAAAVVVEVVDGDGKGVGTGDDGCLEDDDKNGEETAVAIDDGTWIGCT